MPSPHLHLVRPVILALGALLLLATNAQARPDTLSRVRAAGVVHCGSAIRPGLAFPDENGAWYGLNVEVCRAVAAAVLGDPAKISFTGYALRPGFERIRTGADDVAFLTATEMFANGLLGDVLPGPAVFQQTVHIMVWDTSPVRHVSELGRTAVCGEPGTTPDNALHAYAAAVGWQANISPWMELEEMMDAFGVGRCPAIVGEATALAALGIGSGQAGHPARQLPEPLAAYPVMAATPGDDPRWATLVSWTVQTVLAGGTGQGLSIPGAMLGLDKDWQARVLALGDYAAIYRRTLGDGSALALPPGPNANWRNGGLFAPPSID